jgi:S-adenosylmethionine:tRNA ribosyltransferase-isomerase
MSDGPKGSRVSDYDFALPPELVAQYPARHRDESRLLVLGGDGGVSHRRFPDLLDLLRDGDVLVVNESRVFPARLIGSKPTGARAEILLIRPLAGPPGSPTSSDVAARADAAFRDDAVHWEALVRPGGKLKPGRRVVVGDGFEVEIVDTMPSGSRVVRLIADGGVEAALDRYGHVPLPPYIERRDEPIDRERYQTVYARTRGSIAAPTAGLHFTDALLERVSERGVARAEVTLHVGVGTFRPVEVEDPSAHPMHAERYVVTAEAADTINRAREGGGRVWAVGTTAVRTLESVADAEGRVHPGSGQTELFIRPPYRFKVVDGLLTNFHLPRSTLLMLVAAMAGYDATMAAYAEAVRERYRFYSYGDAMAVLPDAVSPT